MSAIRFVVAGVVALPLLLIVGWPHPWYVTPGIAVVSFGLGHLVEFLVRGRGEKTANALPEGAQSDSEL